MSKAEAPQTIDFASAGHDESEGQSKEIQAFLNRGPLDFAIKTAR
jgi:hypothetical protein